MYVNWTVFSAMSHESGQGLGPLGQVILGVDDFQPEHEERPGLDERPVYRDSVDAFMHESYLLYDQPTRHLILQTRTGEPLTSYPH